VVCDTVYNEDKDGAQRDDLPGDWIGSLCDFSKSMFKLAENSSPEAEAGMTASASDHAETTIADVQHSNLIRRWIL